MRRRYAEKRALVHDMLAPLAPHARLRGLEAGLHAFLELREGLDPRAIARLAYERGVFVASLDVFYAGAPDRLGLVLGYGGYPLPELARGVHILREVIEQCATAPGHA
jgi:GntR family transcriptional regulator/MocR family aminotransferase